MIRKSRSGSDNRQRHPDIRIRLDAGEVAMLDACARAAGFEGQHARGAWLRQQIGAAPRPERERAIHQRVPMPGGQAVLAELGKAGVNLQKLLGVLTRFADGDLPAADMQRIRSEMPRMIDQAIAKIVVAVDLVADRLDQLAERTQG